MAVFFKNQPSCYALHVMSSVLLLPPDLLENILVLVVRSSLFPGRTALNISHVCSLWRKVALGCSRLWGIIDTRNKRISSLFVSRTRRSTPLDVLVANSYIVKPPSLFSKHDVLRGRPPRHKESPLVSFETVLPCLQNVRFLSLYLSYQELRSFSAVFQFGMPLQLVSLTIITPPTWEADSNSLEQTRIGALVPSVFIKPQECDEIGTSHLKSLTLTDISLPWTEISSRLSFLTYLAITSPVLRPSLRQIHSILRHTSLLRRLVLDDVFEDAVLDFNSLSQQGDLPPIHLPHLTSLTYNAPSLQAHWLCLLLSRCIVAPLLDNISFRTPEMGHLYRPVGEECRPPSVSDANARYTCKCRMFDPSKLIPNSSVGEETFIGGLSQCIDHLIVSRDAYNPVRGGEGRGYRFYIHGAAKNIDPVDYPSLIPFLRAPSVPFHDPRYFRKFERGILLSGYAYACPYFANKILSSSSQSNMNRRYTCPNSISELISGFTPLAANLVNVRHLELATGGVEILVMKINPLRTLSLCQSRKHTEEGIPKPLGAVRHVTLWGPVSSASSESNIYWRGSDVEKLPNIQPGLLSLIDVLHLLGLRLVESRPRSDNSPLLNRLTLRHLKIEFTHELNEAIENLLGCQYDVVHVDSKKKLESGEMTRKCAGNVFETKLELIDCTNA